MGQIASIRRRGGAPNSSTDAEDDEDKSETHRLSSLSGFITCKTS